MNKFTYLLLLLFCMMGGVTKAYAEIGEAYNTSSWTITASSNAPVDGNEGAIDKAFDGNNATFWHSNWSSDTTDPKWIVIDTKSTETTLGGFTYLPRQDNDNGIWLSYKIYVSNNPFSDLNKESVLQLPSTDLKKEGSLEKNRNLKKIVFDKEEKGQYILIVITEGNGDRTGKHATCAELTVNKYVDASKVVNVTYTYQLSGVQTTKTKTVEQIIGTAYQAPALDVDFVTFTQPQGTVQVGENQVTVQCTENLPFEKTTDLNSPKWFSVDMHSNQARYMWHYEADNQNIKVAVPEDLVSISKDDAYFWCLTGNVFDGFQIYNKKAGTNKSLNTTSDKPQITEGEHTTWHIVKPQSSISNAACFKADNTQYLNHQIDKTLGYYQNADEGSSCRFFKPATFAIEQAKVIGNIPANAVEGYLNVENLKPAITEAEKDLSNFENANKLVDAIAQLTPNNVTLEAGKYYRLQSKHYPTRYANADMTGAENMQKAISSVVLFEATETEGQYRLKMQGLGLGHATTSTPLTLTSETNDMGSYKAVNKGKALFALKDATSSTAQNSALHDAATQSHKLVGWEENAEASQWYIIPATDVEVALNTAGNASYATTYLPFSVSNVEGATAYIGKKEGESTLRATAIKAGIPANTGVILKSAANAEKAVLTLGKATSNVEGNALTGTLVEKDYTNELVFGVNNNKVGFYSMAAGKKIGANKAYLEAAAATQAMKLVFDGDVTGIENVMGEAADANAPIYDLTGRRVMKAVKGGLYIQNGKKFIAQ